MDQITARNAIVQALFYRHLDRPDSKLSRHDLRVNIESRHGRIHGSSYTRALTVLACENIIEGSDPDRHGSNRKHRLTGRGLQLAA